MLLPPQPILEACQSTLRTSNLVKEELTPTEDHRSRNVTSLTTSLTRSSSTSRVDQLDRQLVGRHRQRASRPLDNSQSTAIDSEKIQQTFFPSFEEAGQNAILDPRIPWPIVESQKSAQHDGEHWLRSSSTDEVNGTDQLSRPDLTVSSRSSAARHTRSQSSDSTYTSARSLFTSWGYAPNAVPHQESSSSQSILRESGVRLNLNSHFASGVFMRPDTQDVDMEVHEMRPRSLRRAVTDTAEDLKPKLERSHTIAGSRPTKRKAISTDMGSLGPPFSKTTALRSSTAAPQFTVPSRNTKPRPPPLRELPPPSWSSPGHSPPLTALAPPFSRDMFLFPIKTGANSLPISPVTHQSFSSLMSPPITPNLRLLSNDLVTPTLFAPSALSMSHLSVNYPESIDNRLLTVNRCRRRSSMSSFESTTETIRPWNAHGELTPKPSKAQLTIQAVNRDQLHDISMHVQDHVLFARHSQVDPEWINSQVEEKQHQTRRIDKKSRLAEKEGGLDMLQEKTKVPKRRTESRKTSATLRL
ncbi:hypothetical protein QFC22_005436 [Naganishia vaughanmartiniae]|uniref:Uncharacterized protein n=1 Tax=Naganishia vaughanmartiniae TaxID=1424756 RepID=A0ACC2WWB0_9TREE|nr:hypothetical protein QFC22_005436 [Naganishia vaughanmartiniae]